MNEVLGVRFTTGGKDKNRQLVQEYILDAVERLPRLDYVEHSSFIQSTQQAPERASVVLSAVGDRDRLVENESQRWDELVEQELIIDWRTTDYTELWEEQYGDRALELRLHFSEIANQTSQLIFERFDEAPSVIDAFPEENNAHPIGWYTLLHQLTLQQGYSFDEELDAYTQLLKMTIRNLTNVEEEEHVNKKIDNIISELDEIRPAE